MRSFVLLFPLCGAVFYMAYLLLMFFFQRALIFPASIRGEGAAISVVFGEEHMLPAELGVDGVLLLPPDSPEAPIMMIAHGNAELIVDWDDVAATLVAEGCGVLLVEFPGYGQTEGKAGQEAIGAAFDRAYEWLREDKGVPASRIFALGRSIGTGVACDLSTRKELAGLILISPFQSIRQFARRRFLPSFLLRHPFDNDLAVAAFDQPVLIFHGLYDQVIPFSDGEALAGLAKESEFVEMQCRHDDFPLSSADVVGKISEFMRAK